MDDRSMQTGADFARCQIQSLLDYGIDRERADRIFRAARPTYCVRAMEWTIAALKAAATRLDRSWSPGLTLTDRTLPEAYAVFNYVLRLSVDELKDAGGNVRILSAPALKIQRRFTDLGIPIPSARDAWALELVLRGALEAINPQLPITVFQR